MNDTTRPVTVRDWLAVGGGIFGAFKAILDIQITNASLADIGGAIGATAADQSWISTGYLMAEIVVIPLTGWLASVFGLRRYLAVNSALFVLFSISCAAFCSLTQMILFRAGQGFTGGVLIPTALSIVRNRLPAERQSIGIALFGLVATLALALGPTVGGRLTEKVQLALHLLSQYRSRHHRHRVAALRTRLHRNASVGTQAGRLARHRLDDCRSQLARLRAGGGAESRLVRID